MITAALFLCFLLLFIAGTPVGVALGLAGCLAIFMADLGLMAAPTNAYTGIAKYPLLAVPMFVLVGAIFDRSGVALRLVKEPRAPLTPDAVADGLAQIAQRRADFDAALERARGWELDVIARRGEVIERMLALAQA